MILSDRKSASSLLLRLLLFFHSVTRTIQVDVTLRGGRIEPLRSVTCHSLPPGVCCKAPISFYMTGAGERRYVTFPSQYVGFQHLTPGDITAVWQVRLTEGGWRSNAGCSNRIMQTGHGPGQGAYHAPGSDWNAGGASYISVPTIVPPDQGVAKVLTMEGILGLVWGGGKWFASEAARDMVARGGSGGLVGFPKTKSKARRGIRSGEKGTVYAQAPPNWVYPDVIQVNGTEYFGERGSLIYESQEGTVLNLTEASGG